MRYVTSLFEEIKTLDFNMDTVKDIIDNNEKNLENYKTQKIKGVISRQDCMKIVHLVKEKKNLPDIETAMILITGLVQNGGSNKNAGQSTFFNYVNNTLNANEFSNMITLISKNATIRQFCRTMAEDIANFALMLGLRGDLSKQMELSRLNATEEELIWCSNFQTRNPKCPVKVREWLVDNLHNRFKK